MKAKYWAGLVAVALLAVIVGLSLAGSVTVVDPGGQVVSARLVGGGRVQQLHELPWNRFYGIPKLEGAVEVRCINGSTDLGGYVTPHSDTRLTVVTGENCSIS